MNDEGHVLVTGGPDEVTIVVTQAFGPEGEPLVGISEVSFDGYPAVTILVEAAGREGLLHLSPIHGDSRKAGFTDIAPGTKCRLLSPVSHKPLDRVPDTDGDPGTDYYALYLTPERHLGSIVAISDVWGHYHSRIVDNFELISLWDR
jgi:hypothetical protein